MLIDVDAPYGEGLGNSLGVMVGVYLGLVKIQGDLEKFSFQ